MISFYPHTVNKAMLLKWLLPFPQIETSQGLCYPIFTAAITNHVRKLPHIFPGIPHRNAKSRRPQDFRVVHAVSKSDAVLWPDTEIPADILHSPRLSDGVCRLPAGGTAGVVSVPSISKNSSRFIELLSS